MKCFLLKDVEAEGEVIRKGELCDIEKVCGRERESRLCRSVQRAHRRAVLGLSGRAGGSEVMSEMFKFETANFVVRAVIEPDDDVDLSFDETNETAEKVASGEWQCFGTIVTVSTRDGIEQMGKGQHLGFGLREPGRLFQGASRRSRPVRIGALSRSGQGRDQRSPQEGQCNTRAGGGSDDAKPSAAAGSRRSSTS